MTKQIKKYVKPSFQIQKGLARFEEDAINSVVISQGITKKEAKELLRNDAKFLEIMTIKDKQLRMEMMDTTLPKILKALETKVERGSMEQAQKAMTAWSIGKDKAMGADKYSKAINIGGENVQVNLGFKFKAYDKDKKKK